MKNKNIVLAILIVCFLGITGFHLSVLIGLIPFDIVWGGRIQTPEQMYVFETISFIANTLIFIIFLINLGYLTKNIRMKRIAKKAMWVVFAIFAINTVGNLFAISAFERLFFTPITLVLAGVSWYLATRMEEAIL